MLPLHLDGLKPLDVAITPGWPRMDALQAWLGSRVRLSTTHGEQHSLLMCCLETGQTDDKFGAMMMSDL